MGGSTPLADMVKWLSSEVSNLMSWVRLPLSALLSFAGVRLNLYHGFGLHVRAAML